ncbi:MAG: menaquinone biosynthesis decarboxylase [Clostridia bacterium]|nr:menaquinone biosynthesis decarboxylase [Clostridia bacterium]
MAPSRPGGRGEARPLGPFDNLRQFIQHLEASGELRRVTEPVSPRLEITEITDRIVKRGGPALLFENVEGSDLPVVINLFGSRRRVSWALGVEDVEELASRLETLFDLEGIRGGPLAAFSLLPRLQDLRSLAPRRVRSAPCQEVVQTGDQVDLRRLPVLTCWPGDAGPFITLPLVITRDPETGRVNVGMYRLQVLDGRTTAVHWQRHKTGARHFAKARATGRRLEVAVALGGDPALIYAATAPLPDALDEYAFAGLLRRRPVEVVPARTVDLEVPAQAEIVLEGYVDPAEPLVTEGPFGDHTGFYSLEDDYPVFHVTAVTSRRDPLYPTTIVGRPPMEDYWLGFATERIFLPLVRLMLPEVVDYHMPAEGVFHNLVFVSIQKQYPGQAFKVANGLWGLGLLSLAKVIVVCDEDVNVQDPFEVRWVALNNIDPQRDVRFTAGPVDVLDHASSHFTFGTKMVIDATRKWPEEGFTRRWPERIRMSREVVELVDRKWRLYGLD